MAYDDGEFKKKEQAEDFAEEKSKRSLSPFLPDLRDPFRFLVPFYARRMAAVKTPAPIRAEPPAKFIIFMVRGFVAASRALAARSAYKVALTTARITKVDPKMRI
jgi:hypothetical protein